MAVTPEIADTMEMTGAIELAVEDRIREYIKNYSSNIPLTKKWVKKKGNNLFFYDTGNTYNTIFAFTGSKWREFEVLSDNFSDVSQGFKYASYMKTKHGIRAFLPNGEKSFDSSGEATAEFCEWVESIILDVLEEFI